MGDHDEPQVIPDQPLRPEEVLAQEELTSEAHTLSSDGGTRRMREGSVSIGRPRILVLRDDELTDAVRRRPGATERTFVLVHMLFDLDDLRGSRRYRTAQFRVVLNVPDAVAHSLWPILVTTQAEVETSRTFGLQVDLSLGALQGAPSAELSRGTVFRFTSLQPVITAFGLGRPRFSWAFTSQATADLEPGNRSVFAVLDLPVGTPTITGTFGWEVAVARKRMGVFETVDAHTRTVPFRIRLDTGETTLVQPE